MRRPPAPPLDLTRLVMRRAAWVVLAVLLGATVLGLVWVGRDIDEEADAAVALAQLVAGVSALSTMDDAEALRSLRELPATAPTRHLVLKVRTPTGLMVLGEAEPPPQRWPLEPILSLHRQLFSRTEPRAVSWALPRPDGRRWTVTLVTSHESERAEALSALLRMLLMLLVSAGGLLLVMRWNVRRALAPLDSLLQAIARIESGDDSAADALPPMPIRELESVARALRHLAAALRDAEAERRALGRRVMTLQEDERARLARELHDEFGQHLTALRVDAAWLARSGSNGHPQAAEVLASMTQHVQHIQAELRSVLDRLRPLHRHDEAAAARGEGLFTLDSLAQMLRNLVEGWRGRPALQHRVTLHLAAMDGAGRPGPWPADAATRPLPAPLGLAVYRITQEALTNVARHAGAQSAEVSLTWHDDGRLSWEVRDDGVGLPDPAAALLRGSGLAGIKERIWALGADLAASPARPATPGATRPGLRLHAVLQVADDDPANDTPDDPAGPAGAARDEAPAQ